MICNKCSKVLSDDLYYCDNCGAPTGKDTQWTPYGNETNQNPGSYSNGNYGNYNNPGGYNNGGQGNYGNYGNYNNNFGLYNTAQEIDKKIEDSRLLGILAIVLGFFVTSIIGIILGAVGLAKLNDIPFDFQNYNIEKREKARKLNVAGIVAPLVVRVLFWICYFVFVFAIVSASY